MAAFDPKADAEVCHKAIKGAGTDEKALISVFGYRSKQQLHEIANEYQAAHGNTLYKDIDGDCSGNFRELMLWLLLPSAGVRKELLKKATKGAGTAEVYLIDALAPATNQEVLDLYQHDPSIVKDVLNDVSHGDFAKVVNELLKGKRDENPHIDESEAAAVAEKLYKAGEGKLGTDEDTFTALLTKHGSLFLQKASSLYASKHKHGLEVAIKKETSGYYEDILVALVQTPLQYYAERLFSAMKGLGTDERALNYIFGLLSRHDLHQVAAILHEKHKDKTLEKMVESDCSSYYRDLLLALLK